MAKQKSDRTVPARNVAPPLTEPVQEPNYLIRPLALRAMFMQPRYLEPSAWLEHIPFAFWLIEAHQPRTVVELGTHYGSSYFAFCQAVQYLGLDTQCYAVDHWKGDEHAGLYGEEVYEKVKAHNDANYSTFSRLVRSTFDEAVTHFPDQSIDLLHIDGYHLLDAVQRDFETWLPRLSDQAIVLIHDSNVRERNFGVFKFVEQLRESYPVFEFMHGHGLSVVLVGTKQSDLVKRLFDAREDKYFRHVVHEVFGRLGRACADGYVARNHQVRVHDLERAANRYKRDLEELKGNLEKTKADLTGASNKLRDALQNAKKQEDRHLGDRSELSARISLLQELRCEQKEEIARLGRRIEDLSTDVKARSEAFSALQLSVDEHRNFAARTEKDADELRERLAGARADSSLLKAELDRAKAEFLAQAQEKEAALSARQEAAAAILARDAEIGRLREELDARKAEFLVQAQEKEAALSARQEAAAAILARDAEIGRLREELDARKAEFLVQAQEKEAALSARQEAAAAILARDEEIARLREDLEKTTLAFNASQQKATDAIGARMREVTQLRQEAEARKAEGERIRAENAAEARKYDAEKRALEQRLEERFDEIAMLTKMVTEKQERAERLLADKSVEGKQFETERQGLEQRLAAQAQKFNVEKRALEQRLKERFDEIAVLTKMVMEKQTRAEKLQHASEDIRRAMAALLDVDQKTLFGKIGFVRKARVRKRAALLQRCEIFDADWYRQRYKDVADAGVDPLRHYVEHGIREGRDANSLQAEVRGQA
jgi:hypothetical protein